MYIFQTIDTLLILATVHTVHSVSVAGQGKSTLSSLINGHACLFIFQKMEQFLPMFG